MKALTGRRAERVLADDVEAFERLGYRPLERTSPLAVPLEAPAGAADLVVRLHREGRVFGANLALEVMTAEPVLPATGRELTARGQGVVKLRGVRFRARGGTRRGPRRARGGHRRRPAGNPALGGCDRGKDVPPDLPSGAAPPGRA